MEEEEDGEGTPMRKKSEAKRGEEMGEDRKIREGPKTILRNY